MDHGVLADCTAALNRVVETLSVVVAMRPATDAHPKQSLDLHVLPPHVIVKTLEAVGSLFGRLQDVHAVISYMTSSPSDTVRLLLKSPPVTAALAALGGLLAACGVPDPWQLTDPHGPPAILMFDGLVGDVASDEEFANAVRWADAVFGAQPRATTRGLVDPAGLDSKQPEEDLADCKDGEGEGAASSSGEAASTPAPLAWSFLKCHHTHAQAAPITTSSLLRLYKRCLVRCAFAFNLLASEDGAEFSRAGMLWFVRVHPACLNFDLKLQLFRKQHAHLLADGYVEDDGDGVTEGSEGRSRSGVPLMLRIRRARVLEDSYAYLRTEAKAQAVRERLRVQFVDEDAAGPGVKREWFNVVCRDVFDPEQGLFVMCSSLPDSSGDGVDMSAYQPSGNPSFGDGSEAMFVFVGRFIGLGLLHQQLLSVRFPRVFYCMLVGQHFSLQDLRDVDPVFASSMHTLLNTEDVEALCLQFCPDGGELLHSSEEEVAMPSDAAAACGGALQACALVDVDHLNLHAYVRHTVTQRVTRGVLQSLQAIVMGVWEVVPKASLSLFTAAEVEVLLSGSPDIDVEDWERHTEYAELSPRSPTVKWFWQVVKDFTPQLRSDLLMFVTGSPRTPLGGFACLPGNNGDIIRFQLCNAFKDGSFIPSAHTCFNQLSVSTAYGSQAVLRDRLLTAIAEGRNQFSMV